MDAHQASALLDKYRSAVLAHKALYDAALALDTPRGRPQVELGNELRQEAVDLRKQIIEAMLGEKPSE